MTLIRKLGLALCWVLWSVSYSNAQTVSELDPSQTYNTGNIVIPTTTSSGSTWVGGVYQDQLECWSGGGPGYCGPNPVVRPGGNINFSYGSVYLYQEQLTAGLLPSGTGLQIRGYDFSFVAKNGNGWDDGRTDQLSALVRFWDTTNYKGTDNLVYGNSWNLSYQFDWTRFTFGETFTTPYDASTIGRVQYGFIGEDNNFWAGTYGPEIYDVTFNIRYGVDPCANDPLFSSTCPGYLTALQSLIPDIAPTTELAVSQPEPIAEVQTIATASVQSLPQSQTQQSSEPVQTVQQTSSTNSATQEEKKEKKEGASLSTILSIVRNEQDRISSVESKVVEAANEQAQQAANQATENAEAIAQSSSDQSVALSNEQSNQSQSQSSGSTNAQQSSSVQILNNNQQNITQQTIQEVSIQQQNNISVDIKPQSTKEVEVTVNNNFSIAPPNQVQQKIDSESSKEEIVLVTPNAPVQVENKSNEDVFTPKENNITAETQNKVEETQTNLSMVEMIDEPIAQGLKVVNFNPAEDIVPKMILPNADQNQGTDSVRKNVQSNELAGGVDLSSIATQPKGFESYSAVLADTSFYEPKEIYKGQKVVDNVRALRQLASDKKHQEMIDAQYRK